MSNLITVIAATLDEKQLTLYLEDGSIVGIKQGDPRVARLVPEMMPHLAAKKPVQVDISVEEDRSYAKLEDKTNGVVKFFRIARNKLSAIFKKHKPEEDPDAEIVEGFDYIGSSQEAAVKEIMENAVSAQSPTFEDVGVSQDELNNDRNIHSEEGDTVIAVVDGKTVVPDAHNIKHHIDHAANGNEEGITNFFRRFAAVADKRQHTARDLMKFIQKGDLHFANDGSLLIYKALRSSRGYGNVDKELFVDCHTGNVPQRIGSHVCMDPSLVDPNRHNECSNGLHVARRQYIRNFGGDVLTLCKVAPEDVIAVPEYDANKMRVCGYHILFRLNPTDHAAIKANNPLETDEGKRMLAACIAGEHVGVLQTVKIGGHKGTNITITDHVDNLKASEARVTSTQRITTLAPVEALNATERENNLNGEKLDLKTVQSQKEETVTLSRKEQAKVLYDDWVWQTENNTDDVPVALKALLDFKKAAKVSWDKLGIPNDGSKPVLVEASSEAEEVSIGKLVDLYETFNMAKAGSDEETLISREFITLWDEAALGFNDEGFNDDVGVDESDVDLIRVFALRELYKPVESKTAPTPSDKPKSARERIRAILDDGPMTIGKAKDILAIKKSAKKGWDKLGVSDVEAFNIETQLS